MYKWPKTEFAEFFCSILDYRGIGFFFLHKKKGRNRTSEAEGKNEYLVNKIFQVKSPLQCNKIFEHSPISYELSLTINRVCNKLNVLVFVRGGIVHKILNDETH